MVPANAPATPPAVASPAAAPAAALAAIQALRASMPDAAKDVRLNLPAVLAAGGAPSPAQTFGCALAAAWSLRRRDLVDALVTDARAALGEAFAAVNDDAVTAATLMAMNNVYYRFRHQVGKPEYGTRPARLRMTKLATPATTRADLELFSLAVSALNGCEACVRAHEATALGHGLGVAHVEDAVRIAAVVASAATALFAGEAIAAAG